MIKIGGMKLMVDNRALWKEFEIKVICEKDGKKKTYQIDIPEDRNEVYDRIAEEFGVDRNDVKKAVEYLEFLYNLNPCEGCDNEGCRSCLVVAEYWDKIARYRLDNFDISELDEKWRLMKEAFGIE